MKEWVKELGWWWVLQQLIEVMSLSEEDKTQLNAELKSEE